VPAASGRRRPIGRAGRDREHPLSRHWAVSLACAVVLVVGCGQASGTGPLATPPGGSPAASTPAATPSPAAATSPAVTPSPAATVGPRPGPADWPRVSSPGRGYSLALPPGSYLAEPVAPQEGEQAFDQWYVMTPAGALAFGLLVTFVAEPTATLPPESADLLEMTVDGTRFVVSPAGATELAMAGALHDNGMWVLMARSPDMGSEARQALFLQVLSTFRFPAPGFTPAPAPSPVPAASPSP
jgi:hypothetical protein